MRLVKFRQEVVGQVDDRWVEVRLIIKDRWTGAETGKEDEWRIDGWRMRMFEERLVEIETGKMELKAETAGGETGGGFRQMKVDTDGRQTGEG